MDVGHEALGTREMRTATKWCVPPGGVHATCLEWWRSHRVGPRLLITPIRLKAPFQIHPRRSSSLVRLRLETRSFDAQWAVCCQPSRSQVPGKGHSNQLPQEVEWPKAHDERDTHRLSGPNSGTLVARAGCLVHTNQVGHFGRGAGRSDSLFRKLRREKGPEVHCGSACLSPQGWNTAWT